MHRAEVDIGSEDGAHYGAHDLGFFLVDRQGARVILRRLVAKRHSAPHPHALGLGGRNLVADALARHLALELGEGQQHVQCQAAHAGRGVEGLGDADEADPAAIEDLDHACEVGQGPGQAVNLVDDDDVDLAGLDVAEKPLERRPLHGCAGEAAIVVAGRDRQMLCLPPVQVFQPFMDGLVQFGEAEETAIAQAGQNPALDDLDADFHFRFVPRFARPCRHDRGVVMGRHAGIGAVDLGIVQTGLDDAGLEIVRHDLRRHPAEVGEGAAVRANPVGQRLRPGRLGVGVAGGAQGGDEDLGRADLAGKAVDHLEGGAGIIDEHLLAGHMALTHGRGEPALPGTVEFAEPAVAVAVPMDRAVLFPQQGQRDAGPLQLAMQHRPVAEATGDREKPHSWRMRWSMNHAAGWDTPISRCSFMDETPLRLVRCR